MKTQSVKSLVSSFFAFALVYWALCVGCTVTPQVVRDGQYSWDGNVQNSGFIGHDAQGNRIITPHARKRYNGLVGIYGNKFFPNLVPDAGIEPVGENFKIDAQHLEDFMKMNRWFKQGVKPIPPVP